MNSYVTYHLHSDLSLLDSCTKYQDYINLAVQNKQPAIAFTEHGNIFQWVEKKLYCDSQGIKYIHGVECYLTESLDTKIRDNYHTILLAKNEAGIREINSLVSVSYQDDHFYYKPRITFDEFFRVSPNVIKISACLASPLRRLDVENLAYDKLCQHYDYFEIQPHNHPDQIAYNRQLYQLSIRYNKPLIAGTDTHSLNPYKAECRKILMMAKRIGYTDEDAFDLSYKTYDELVEMFHKQDALPEQTWLQAIENTLVMAESVEDFKLDTSFKYPVLHGSYEQDAEEYERNVQRSLDEKLATGIIPKEQERAFREAIAEESRVFTQVNMRGFMLFMSELIRWCKDNGIAVGPGRGSVGGSRVAYVTDIIDLNPEQWHTVFSRFCNEDRVEAGDIDVDIAPDQRDEVYQHIFDTFGIDHVAYILALGTVSSKGTIDEIGRALGLQWSAAHPGERNNPYSLDVCDQITSAFEANEQQTRERYPELFYYYDGVIDTVVSQSMHPAGIVVSPVTLPDNYGTMIKDGKLILQIDMEAVHDTGLMKYDILGLKTTQIIREAYELAGKPYPYSHEIDWNDQAVWENMRESPIGCFQFESDFAYDSLKKFAPRNLFELSLVTAAIRPSGASYRDELLARHPHKNPSAMIDELLKANLGFLVYQEDIIKFLQEVCGLTGSEADTVRRGIARKKTELLDTMMPKILEGYCAKSDKPREAAVIEAKEFLQIIEDASSYMFGYNHSIEYCMVSYMCAYLRYYYPYEFITAYLNNATNEDDIKNGTALAEMYGIKVTLPKWGLSIDRYVFDKKQHVIAKGLSSIKYMNDKVAQELHDLAQTGLYVDFVDVLYDIKHKTSMDSRQLDILLQLDFFSEFGSISTLRAINAMFSFFKAGQAKSIKKDKENPYWNLMPQFAIDKNVKGDELKSWMIQDCMGLMRAAEAQIRKQKLPPQRVSEIIDAQFKYLGYITYHDPRLKGYYLVLDLNTKYSPKLKLYDLSTGEIQVVKTYSNTYQENPFNKGAIIRAPHIIMKPKSQMINGKWCKLLDDKEPWIQSYQIKGSVDL